MIFSLLLHISTEFYFYNSIQKMDCFNTNKNLKESSFCSKFFLEKKKKKQ
jgi:hypothetical protein